MGRAIVKSYRTPFSSEDGGKEFLHQGAGLHPVSMPHPAAEEVKSHPREIRQLESKRCPVPVYGIHRLRAKGCPVPVYFGGPAGGHQACNARYPNPQHWAHEIIYQRYGFTADRAGVPAAKNQGHPSGKSTTSPVKGVRYPFSVGRQEGGGWLQSFATPINSVSLVGGASRPCALSCATPPASRVHRQSERAKS